MEREGWGGAVHVARSSPKALLAGYFLNAFILSFPMVAMADWLNNRIEMPLATQAQFYAFVFVPNCFKPLYALLANAVAKSGLSRHHAWFRGRSRSLVLQVCGLCMGLLYLSACRVGSVGGAFALFFAINTFAACAEMMLGSLLMDLVHHGRRAQEDDVDDGGGGGGGEGDGDDGGNDEGDDEGDSGKGSMIHDAGAVQALAGGARALGSISASVAAVFMYPCASASAAPDPCTVLGYTGGIAALNFVIAFFLPRVPDDSEGLLPTGLLLKGEKGEKSAGAGGGEEDGVTSPLAGDHHHADNQHTDDGGGGGQSLAPPPLAPKVGPAQAVHRRCRTDSSASSSAWSLSSSSSPPMALRRLAHLASVILLLQGLLIWVSLKDIVFADGDDDDDDSYSVGDPRWWGVLAAFLLAFFAGLFSLLHSVLYRKKNEEAGQALGEPLGESLGGPLGGATHVAPRATAVVVGATPCPGHAGDGGKKKEDPRAAMKELMLQYGMPSLFLFVYNAMPTANEQLFTYTFYLFYSDSPCKVTQLNLISSSATVLSMVAYAAICNRRRIRRVIVSTSILALALGLLWLPLASLDLDDDDGNDTDDANGGSSSSSSSSYGSYYYYYYYDSTPVLQGQCVTWLSERGGSCMDPFTYAAVVQFVTSLAGMLAFTPNTVLATESTPREYKTTAYAVFLSLIDSGDTASGWISASIVSSLGLTFDSWERLPEYIWIASACQLATLVLVPFLRDAKPLTSLHLDRTGSGSGADLGGRPQQGGGYHGACHGSQPIDDDDDDDDDRDDGADAAASNFLDDENDARRSPLLDHEH